MKQSKQDNASSENSGYGFILFLIFLVLMACLYGGIKATQTYLSLSYLEKQGVQTTGTILERINIMPSRTSKNRNHDYYIRYSFKNIYAAEDCAVDLKTRTTSKYRECRTTVRKQIISETEYKSISVPSPVTVLYLSENNETQSYVMGLGGGKTRYTVWMALSLFFSLIIGRFLWKAIGIGPER